MLITIEKDGKKEAAEIYTDEQITNVIDNVFSQMDKDKDGYISYTEFMTTNTQTTASPASHEIKEDKP